MPASYAPGLRWNDASRTPEAAPADLEGYGSETRSRLQVPAVLRRFAGAALRQSATAGPGGGMPSSGGPSGAQDAR